VIHIGREVMDLDGTIDYLSDTVFNYPTLPEAYTRLQRSMRATGSPPSTGSSARQNWSQTAMPTDTLSGEGGGQPRAIADNRTPDFARELFEPVVAIDPVGHADAVSRDVADARECPPVQKCTRLVPSKNRKLAITGNTTCPFAGFFSKPLTDSNRRPLLTMEV
jgi:hypothetical protein